MIERLILINLVLLLGSVHLFGQVPNRPSSFVLKPAAIFDGVNPELHQGWGVWVEGNEIKAVAPLDKLQAPADAVILELQGQVLMPGMIEAHAHVLLHPYNETSWNDQVLRETETERVVRAVQHLRETVLAGFTTIRDLGTEGAGYADVGLKQAIEKELIIGPRMLIATKAIIATGSYAPKRTAFAYEVPQGAEEADGAALVRVVRDQIGRGADWIKVYADYRWGLNGEARPTFTEAELRMVVEVAESAGRHVVAHASTEEGVRRAVMAGIRTIEHGDGGTKEVFALMAARKVALCPTLAAVESISRYAGWEKDRMPAPARVLAKQASFKAAMAAGVPICHGSDVGVFRHGENALEAELMVEYGLSNLETLRALTSGNAEILDLPQLGRVQVGFKADLIAIEGNPLQDIQALRKVQWVMLNGKVVKP